MAYEFHSPELSRAIQGTPVTPKHKALIDVMRQFPSLANADFATLRVGFRADALKLRKPSGEIVADDHRKFLEQELANDDGDVQKTANRLRMLGWQLIECEIENHYFVADLGGAQDNFLQVEIRVSRDRVASRFFDEVGYTRLENFDDLARAAERGDPVAEDQRVQIGLERYELFRCIDVGAFMQEAELIESAKHALLRQRTYTVTEMSYDPRLTDQPKSRVRTADELSPNAKFWVWPQRRLFDDWTSSSAGRAGNRLCKHWVMQVYDYTPHIGERSFWIVPMWTHSRKIAKIEQTENLHLLQAKLTSLDQRSGAPFAWFFYMLHGNLVRARAGVQVLQAAEAGTLDMPEHDYQILRRWNARPYGF